MPKLSKEKRETISKRLQKKTGKSLEQWIELTRKKAPEERREQIQWLKIKQNLDGDFARVIVKMIHEGIGDYDDREVSRLHFSNGKEYLKPVFEKLVQSLRKNGKFSVGVNKGYLSLVNTQQFAVVKASNEGLIVGVPRYAVRSARSKNFVPSKTLGTQKITHKITLVDESDLNESVLRVLRAAYLKFG
jgi:hypothetical protein